MRALPLLALAASLTACANETATPDTTDTTADTSSDTAADTTGDTTPDTTGDTSPEDTDTTPGRTVIGTALEGVDIRWTAPLSLCSEWSEGASLADEEARKVMIELPAQTRSTLDEDALASARIEGALVLRSPFATGRHTPDRSTPRLTAWQLLETGGGGHSLAATIEHTLPDKAGTLFEQYVVARVPGAPDDVEVTPDSFEVTFAWRPFGSDLQPARLANCGGAPDFEDAVSVVTGRAGRDWVTLLRFWRTAPGGEFDAGSYPVVLTGHRLVTSDLPWWPTDVRGFWSHTYVAQHHNWDDATEVDLAGDLGHWHHTLQHRPEGTVVVSRITTEGLHSFGEGAILVERMTDDGPSVTRYTVSDARAFPRVDAAELARAHAELCPAGPLDVLQAGGADHLAQVLFCGTSRPQVVGLVPVVWGSDPTLIAQLFAPTTSASNQWSFEIGVRDVTVFARPDDYLELRVLDDAGELVSQSYEPRQPLALPAPRYSPVTATKRVDGQTLSVQIERLWVTFGVGKSQIYAPVHLLVTWGDRTWLVTSWDRMDYTNTHHNWEDSLMAEADDGTAFTWRTSFMNGVPNALTITASTGETLLPETVLP